MCSDPVYLQEPSQACPKSCTLPSQPDQHRPCRRPATLRLCGTTGAAGQCRARTQQSGAPAAFPAPVGREQRQMCPALPRFPSKHALSHELLAVSWPSQRLLDLWVPAPMMGAPRGGAGGIAGRPGQELVRGENVAISNPSFRYCIKPEEKLPESFLSRRVPYLQLDVSTTNVYYL